MDLQEMRHGPGTVHWGSDPNLWGPKTRRLSVPQAQESEGKACSSLLPGVL